MEEFLRFVLTQLVDAPEDLVISHGRIEKKDVFRIAARKSDIPRIIGRDGHTIQAIRSLLDAAAKKHGGKAVLEIIE